MRLGLFFGRLDKLLQEKKWSIDYQLLLLITLLVVIIFLSLNNWLDWRLKGDGFAYFQALQVVNGETVTDFIPNRFLTTFLSLNTILIIDKFVGNFLISWYIMNLSFFLILNLTFYYLIKKIFKSGTVAILGVLFLATNYGILLGGMWNFIMDMGGWACFMLTAMYLLIHTENPKNKYLLFASLAVGLGGLLKEYAFGGLIMIAVYLLYNTKFNVISFIKKMSLPTVIIILPAIVLHLYVYLKYNYSYFDWIDAQAGYVYSSRFIEYFKSFGSLVNFLAFPFLGGVYYFLKDYKTNNLVSLKHKQLIYAIILSSLPIFLWPAITQRTLALSIIPIVLISCFCFKVLERKWYYFVPVLAMYTIVNFMMDTFVLDFVNLPL